MKFIQFLLGFATGASGRVKSNLNRSGLVGRWRFKPSMYVPVLAIFAVLGVLLLLRTFAAEGTISMEAESGTLTGNASVQGDSSASNGSFVSFRPSTGNPNTAIPVQIFDANQIGLTQFGDRSHWLQPWKAWLATPTASEYLDRFGIAWNAQPEHYAAVGQKVSAAGIKRVRVEVPWDSINWEETGFADTGRFDNLMNVYKQNGLRPILLLNANQGGPGPNQQWDAVTTTFAGQGSTTVQVTQETANRIVPGYSGFSWLEYGRAMEVIFKSVNGSTVTLSKPLPESFQPGNHAAHTLRYRPFYYPGTPEMEQTLAGWFKYADIVKANADRTLGANNYDIEVWNELTFGSDFLHLPYYDHSYSRDRGDAYNSDSTGEIARRTIRHLRSKGFQGAVIDGFTNTVPWPSQARDEPGYSGHSRHPYSTGRASGPPWTVSGTPLNALGQVASFEPSYTSISMPEWYLNILQTEGHARYLYPGGGQRIGDTPVGPDHDKEFWATEIRSRDTPHSINPINDRVVQKEVLRLYTSWPGKGVKVFPYATGPNDPENLELVDPAHAEGGAVMAALKRMTTAMAPGSVTTRRQVLLRGITDNHNAAIFNGNGSAGHPNLFERDAVFVQPVQVSGNKIAVPAYVMTRNIEPDHPGRQFSLTFGTFGANVSATALDPLTGASVPVSVNRASNGDTTFTLNLTDYPRVLVIND